MSEVITLRGTKHVLWECKSCGVVSTCPEVLWDQQYAEGGFHHCPNGHSWGWTKETCEREKLRAERDRLKQREAMHLQQIADADARTAKAEAATKRLKKRTSAGTCPCCKRTFSNMAEHMKHQHPQFVEGLGATVVPIKSRST